MSRLLPGLTGAARETVVMWNAADFEREDGADVLLQRLAATALVRRPLPDANAALDKYLNDFRRRAGETMAHFLTREHGMHEDFREAVERLLEEKPAHAAQPLETLNETGESDDESEKGVKGKGKSKGKKKARAAKGSPAVIGKVDLPSTPAPDRLAQFLDIVHGWRLLRAPRRSGKQ